MCENVGFPTAYPRYKPSSVEMACNKIEHSPNKQSKTEIQGVNTELSNSAAKCGSQSNNLEVNNLDLEYERSSFDLQLESKPVYYKCSFPELSQSVSSSVSSSTVSSSFPAKRPIHSMTPCGDNFSSFKTRKSQLTKPSIGGTYNSATSYLPSQFDSAMDLGYSSNSGDSSYQGQDKDSQRDSLTVDQGSQLDLMMSPDQGLAWSDDNCGGDYLHGESELEDLLYHFRKYI